MFRSAALRHASLHLLALLLIGGSALAAEADQDEDDERPAKPVSEVIVTAKRLDAARANIEPSLGAATYTLSNEVVESRPGSETISISQVLVQVPGVQQDGSGQLHVRQSQGNLEYRINNVIVPEGVSDLGESLSARVALKVELVTGALPAQYGFQAGGVVNVTTKDGVYLDGGQAELYGGSHGEIEPAVEYGGSIGDTNVFVTGRYMRNHVGLASPDRSSTPDHDRTDQIDGLAFIDHLLNPETRLSLILGASDEHFQIPDPRGLNAATTISPDQTFRRPLVIGGVSSFPSEGLDDTRREANRFGMLSLMKATDRTTIQAALFTRASHITQRADGLGDLLFHGLGQSADTDDLSYGTQIEAVQETTDEHTIRAGIVVATDTANSSARSQALSTDVIGRQISRTPLIFVDSSRKTTTKESLFLQDEWRATDDLTVNAGLRWDHANGPGSQRQLSPRFNAVWTAPSGFVLHGGYARYFLPAPKEEAGDSAAELANTTGAWPTTKGDPLHAETDDYYDLGLQRTFDDLTLGADAYWRQARNLLAEGQFGPANLSKTFNYGSARIRGVEFSATYAEGPLSAWANVSIAQSEGRSVVSNQFYFTAAQLAFLAARLTPLAQDQAYTVSAGASYRVGGFRFSGDLIYGSGLPATVLGGTPNGNHLPGYAQVNLATVYYRTLIDEQPTTIRLDVINVLDARYQITDGSGLGNGPPQWGPRRGFLIGIEQAF